MSNAIELKPDQKQGGLFEYMGVISALSQAELYKFDPLNEEKDDDFCVYVFTVGAMGFTICGSTLIYLRYRETSMGNWGRRASVLKINTEIRDRDDYEITFSQQLFNDAIYDAIEKQLIDHFTIG